MKKRKYIDTEWEIRRCDVWRNVEGWKVNEVYSVGTVKLRLRVVEDNPGTVGAFESAYPSDRQIRQALGVPRIRLELRGNDTKILVDAAADGYPIGEMRCVSHSSLIPIREGREV